ncbi:type VII secretion system ESX-4 FtsK/SpoIIIE family ATPase EccC4 [soil metagenome]
MDEPPQHTTIPVTAPPPVPNPPSSGLLARLIPLGTLVVTGGMVAVVFAVGSPLLSNPMFLAFPVMMAFSAIASLAHGAGRQTTTELNAGRRRYLEYLDTVGERLSESAAAQRTWLMQLHPDPDALWSLADSARRWERHPGHHAFCRVRFGTGHVAAAARPIPPVQADLDDVDPVTSASVQRLVDAYAVVSDVPVTLDVRAAPLLRLVGDDAAVRALARALLCQLAVFHSPAVISIAAVVAERQRAQWDWVKWLPHQGSPRVSDDLGPVRLVYPTVAEALAGVGTHGGHVVVIVDGIEVAADSFAGHPAVTGVCLGGQPSPGDELLNVGAVEADAMSLVAATTCARRLAAYRGAVERGVRQGWLDLAGVSAPEALTARWAALSAAPLRVPLGVGDSGEPLHLDIKEAAFGGMGPHGLCLGATGSGKSELLRTIALGMIALHSPEQLNLILVDFKGGATFLGLERAHHVTAVITNLADEAYLVDRMQDALAGEIRRRQQLLRDTGNLPGIGAYNEVRGQRPALPALFVIVDEFSELLSQQPDFIDVFVEIGRLGRSLGIHLLLASQRLDEGRLRGLDSHLSYRICLKTLSPNESRIAIGVPDAYHLPASPGSGYLKTGPDNPIKFRAAHVSGPAPTTGSPEWDGAVLTKPVPFTAAVRGPLRKAGAGSATPAQRRMLDAVLDAVAGHGPRAHQVWLPPLSSSPTLDDLVPGVAAGSLTVPMAISDRAFEQRLVPVTLELSGAAGSVAVVGAPQSGKSTALRTIATALAATHRPELVQLYCLDFGGGALASLSDLPHVGVVAGRQSPDLVHRTVAQMTSLVRRREVLFGQLGIESMADYRRRGGDRSDPYGDVFLVVDGWATVRQEFDTVEPAITALASGGLSFGVHVMLTASRWADIRPALKDQIGTRIELRLGDPIDSEIDRKRAHRVPKNRPGHGLGPDGYPMVVALPGPTAHRIGAAAPRVRVLPDHADYQELPRGGAKPMLGIGDDETPATTLDFTAQPFLVISGDSGCGKTSALRLLCHEIARTTTAADLYVVDPRKSLRDDIDPGRLTGYAADAEQCSDVVAALRRHPAGREVYLVVDDYDLVSGAAQGNPLSAVVDSLPYARDIGLRVILARRSGGAARALYDPVLGMLRDLEAAGLQMSHTGDDGPLLGRSRPRPLRPGRGMLITRAGESLVQVAWIPPR